MGLGQASSSVLHGSELQRAVASHGDAVVGSQNHHPSPKSMLCWYIEHELMECEGRFARYVYADAVVELAEA